MAQSQDDRLSGDFSVTPSPYGEEDRPSLSHDVVATYVADAARSVAGVVDLHAPLWKGISYHAREHHGGVVVRDSQPGTVDLDIHLKIAWGSRIPDLAAAVEQAVRQRVTALLNIDIDSVTLFIDEITGPLEVTAGKED
jgi:uncharacterized alkaline shock family protein YloU